MLLDMENNPSNHTSNNTGLVALSMTSAYATSAEGAPPPSYHQTSVATAVANSPLPSFTSNHHHHPQPPPHQQNPNCNLLQHQMLLNNPNHHQHHHSLHSQSSHNQHHHHHHHHNNHPNLSCSHPHLDTSSYSMFSSASSSPGGGGSATTTGAGGTSTATAMDVGASGGGGNNGAGPPSTPSYHHQYQIATGTTGGAPPAAVATTLTVPIGAADLPDTKDCIEELCPVCGDKVSGYHYGLLTCESCKGFFKRTVQNKKVYTCVAERSCHIDKTQRKRCPYCRFQKCLDVGMKLEAVRADRMRGGRNKFGPMYKRDRARKLQIMRQRQLAGQVLRGSLSDASIYGSTQAGTSPFANIHIKQEIQIPQVSSLTSSPDSSPSPITVALGHVSVTSANGVNGNLFQAVNSNETNGNGTINGQPALQIVGLTGATSAMNMVDSKLWVQANSTTTSPHSLSPKSFQFDNGTTTLNQSISSAGNLGNGNSVGGGACGSVSASNASGGSVVNSALKVSPLIRDFVQTIDDREWQNSLYGLLQNQTYNQCEVDLFELMCKVLDQNLFSQVDWARNSIFFKDLKVDDQMKLLQHSWSDMLVLDHVHQRMHNNLPDETTLHNGQKFDLLSLGLLGVPALADHFNDITNKLQELKMDVSDYICVKFLLLLNPDVRGITNRKHVQEGYEQVQQALLEYTVTCYPQVPGKFSKMMQLLPEIHELAARGEEHLYHKHCNGSAPTQTLLMEMLHAKRK